MTAFDSRTMRRPKSNKNGATENLALVSPSKSPAYEMLVQYEKVTSTMSELVEISKLNGSFKRNYGTFIGAYLYLRSISAARGRAHLWGSVWFALASVGVTWLEKYGLL
jgi:hypothetical protein